MHPEQLQTITLVKNLAPTALSEDRVVLLHVRRCVGTRPHMLRRAAAASRCLSACITAGNTARSSMCHQIDMHKCASLATLCMHEVLQPFSLLPCIRGIAVLLWQGAKMD